MTTTSMCLKSCKLDAQGPRPLCGVRQIHSTYIPSLCCNAAILVQVFCGAVDCLCATGLCYKWDGNHYGKCAG